MVDPTLMNVLDNFLNCDDNDESLPFVNSLPKRQNSEILDEVIKELEDPQHLKTASIHSPDIDISDLSLEDLINIDSNVNHEAVVSDSFLDRSSTVNNDETLINGPFDFGAGDNVKNACKLGHVDSFENVANDSPAIDFVVDSNNEIWSYIDCMQPSLSKAIEDEEERVDQNYIEDSIFSNYIDGLLMQCESEDIELPNQDCSSDENLTVLKEAFAIPNKSFSYNIATENYQTEPITNSPEYNSTSNSEAALEMSSESLFNETGKKRPLDESMNEIEKAVTKRGKPSQEWNTINQLIMDDKMDKETIKKIKNNEASRIHRVKKKEKFKDLFKRKTELEKSNAKLHVQVEVMQREANLLRDLLLAKISSSAK